MPSGLIRDIQRYLTDEPVEARPPSTGYRLQKFLKRHKVPVAAAMVVLLTLLVGIAGTTYGLIEAIAAKQQAERRLLQLETANDILGSIFANLDPEEVARQEVPLSAILARNLDQAVAELEGEAIGDPLVVAEMQAKLGKSLIGLGLPHKAVVLLKKALATYQAKLGPEHPHTLISMNNLALAYQDSGDLEHALPLNEEELKLQDRKIVH